MRVLVLGQSGFIGQNCVAQLTKDGVIVPRFTKVDLRVEDNVKRIFDCEPYDVVIQAAATTTGSKDVMLNPSLHVTDNAVMNSWIFREAVIAKAGHVIFPSCTVMYQPKEEKQKESDWNANDEIYGNYFGVGNTKVYLEKMCEFYSRLGDTKFTAIRHSNVFGPHDKYDLDKCHVIPAFIRKAYESNGTMEIWGSGKAARDVLYIDDLVEFIKLAVEKQKEKYGLYNVGSEKAYSIKEIAQAALHAFEKGETKFVFDTSKPDIPTTVILNCAKAREELGWRPRTDFYEGMDKTARWYEKQVN